MLHEFIRIHIQDCSWVYSSRLKVRSYHNFLRNLIFLFFIYFYLHFLQVMYSFVMRPESLPKSYQDFIQKTGPVAQPVYKAVRDCCRGLPVDVASLSAYLSERKNSDHIKLEEFPSIIPCSVIHPDSSSCLAHNANATSATFRKTFPLYFSLTFVPFVVLHLQKVYYSP